MLETLKKGEETVLESISKDLSYTDEHFKQQ